MNNLYLFNGGVYNQGALGLVLESELRKCKTQEERDEVMRAYQTTTLLSLIGSIALGALVCGVLSLFM